ncbi:phage tail protein [Micromonospora sp. WMMC273]|uniref:phage tail protein n=1 Tax=Micromonospora sp. WMMC273 TaxID=3015157 RepID=UPI0022B6FC97|nr:hypothetical protein [Micromonospora sp. WMMC273]MCZ7478876.1 hypothetical protein [Micromonospora sp. WMMC273]
MAAEVAQELALVDERIESTQRQVRELAREFARTGDVDMFVKLRNEKATLAQLRMVRNAIDEVGDEARETERELSGAVTVMAANTSGLNKVFGKTVETVTALGAAAVGLGASAPTPAGLVAIALTLTALVALTPAVIGLGAAIADLVGLVVVAPAGIAVLGAVFGTAKVALMGFADALDAVMEGDPEKVAEALKSLSPAARSVVREFQKLLPQFRELKKAVQDSFFKQLKGELTATSSQLLPVFNRGMTQVGASLGRLGKSLGETLRSPQAVKFIGDAFASASRIIDKMGPGLNAFLRILMQLGTLALPYVEQFVGWLSKGAVNLEKFLGTAEGKNALNDFLDDALASLKDVLALGQALWRLLGALFGNADDEGRSFLQTLTDIVNKLAEFLESDQGQEFIQNLLDLLPLLGQSLAQTVAMIAIGATAVNWLVNALVSLGEWLSQIPGWASSAGSAISGAFSSAWSAVTGFFSSVGAWIAGIPGWFASIGSSIAGAFSSAWSSVVAFFTMLGQWFAQLPGRILGFLAQVGQFIVDGFRNGFNRALEAVGVGIGLILYAVLVLPQQIWGYLQSLPSVLASLFRQAWEWARITTVNAIAAIVAWATALPGRVAAGLSSLRARAVAVFTSAWNSARTLTVNAFNATVAYVQTLPGRIGSALGSLAGRVASVFTRMGSSARAAAVSGFNSVVSYIASVPGRISALGGRMLSAGRSIMSGFFRGLSSAGGMAGNVGASIVSSVRRGLNGVIGRINAGIGSIDAKLPGSLPRIPYLATGGMTLRPTIAALSETGKRELVLPLEDKRVMAALRNALGFGGGRGEPSVVFAKGSITVTFAGVVPTPQEAYQTGREVGRGVAATLSRSNIATQVRTI